MSYRYHIRLPVFEGPFDLLVFFVVRDELDIHDIPLARVTEDFLDYMRQADAWDIQLASEFSWMAATLMRFKAKRLVPVSFQEDQEDLSEEEFKLELAERLKVYKRYKDMVYPLEQMEAGRIMKFHRGNRDFEITHLLEIQENLMEMEKMTLEKLLGSYLKVQQKLVEIIPEDIQILEGPLHTVEEKKEELLNLLQTEQRISFHKLCAGTSERVGIICVFLAILELIYAQQIDCLLGEGKNQFWLSTKDKSI
ncbi:MAG: ScpA family protein [Cytophagales bacterium]|nr:ScpA family protein [Cytophagales bacterium]